MAFQFLFVFTLLNIVFAESNGVVPEEVYWESVFPNNPMPKGLKDILPTGKYDFSVSLPDEFDDWSEDFSGNHENKGPHNESKGKFDWSSLNSGNLAKTDEFDDWSEDFSGNHENKGPHNESKGKGVASIDETIFFFQKDLRSGKLVNLPNLVTRDKTPFLQDRVAKSIPFSSDKLSEILNYFSLKPQTWEANIMYKTIKGCERVAMKGEQKFCATSLESFIDSSISELGKQIQLLSSELSKETKNPLFTITRGMQNMGDNELVLVCHKKKYPGAVFSCHSINRTTLYKVPLVGKDGTKANALAVCHKDTSAWNPKHMAFRILKTKPGTDPVCHFLFRDTLVWISNK
ncbi:hypothetical protein V6N11_013438 [Hibiscus sabdariffa]|uniref:BURP domain-containing protein n=1 Tax=Hibiscus sabdariffa TaxID=183260 RepID=A0ABR2NNU2_9ROSI